MLSWIQEKAIRQIVTTMTKSLKYDNNRHFDDKNLKMPSSFT